jgi:hypothetical protein
MSIPDELDGIPVNEPERPRPRVATLTTALKNCPNEDHAATVTPIYAHCFAAWILSWLGTALAGGTFGLGVGILEGGGEGILIGPIAGVLIAGAIGAPLFATIGILTWLLWLTRFRRAAPSVAGACTGIASTATLLLSSGDNILLLLLVTIAALLGAIGGFLPAAMYWNKRAPIEQLINDTHNQTWQFSLRGLFQRFTVASFLLAAWIFLLGKLLR